MSPGKFVLFSVLTVGCSGETQTSGVPGGTGGTGTDGTSGTAGAAGTTGASGATGTAGDRGNGGGIGGAGGAMVPDGAVPDRGAGDSPGVRPPRPDQLCDGSTEVRLLIYQSGGRGTVPRFAAPFGHRFAFVDGQCRLFAGGYYAEGYRSGLLTPEQAMQVALETFWAYLPELDGLATEQCPDSPHLVLTDGQHTARWRCPMSGVPSFGLLASLGTLLDGPVLVATAARRPPSGATVLEWPIALPPSAFADADSGDPWNTAGVRVTDAADAARLRQLRGRAVPGYPGAPDPLWVRAGDGGPTYAGYVRDDVPEDMRRAVEDMWEREPR
jgi:hypothetical protein